MAATGSQSGRISVIFHHEVETEKKTLNLTQLTALLHTDLIFIDKFKEPKKLEKKVWTTHVNGMDLHIYLK
ncbi:hypothetical protein JOC75_004325 [Metabacillus crassostreae]|uniref:hypothetical protein n=1 Tax=Metabacillus crassostreae TaxID=929098 RepID=UPI0019565A19|nr:hypothetical protein [Metabacillus crassostreae]MBM7606277.1 hypothetical protein [Metabacillus crassostreae]